MGGIRSHTAAAGAAALALLGGGAALAAGGGHEQSGAAAKPRATVLTTSQRNALRLKYVRVRVRSATPGKMRFAARARRSGGGRTYRVTKLRRVTLRGGGSKKFRLKLTRSGRRILGSCRSLVIYAKGRRGRARFKAKPRGVRRDPRRCSASGGPGGGGGGGGGSPPIEDISAPPANPKPLGPVNTANAGRCDFLDPSVCLYPWPNNHFTTADSSKVTDRRLNLNLQSMPSNRNAVPIDPTDQNRADGFSPGNKIVTRVPGLDSQQAFDKTGAVPITDPARSFDPNQPVVVINARTRQRHLIWAEVDSNPADKADRTLIIRPGKNFDEGERYIVALRRLRDETDKLLEPREEFRAYRDGITTLNPDIESRRAHYDGMFKTLGAAGIARKDLYLAWDFTVASERSLSERMLSIRDNAFGEAPLGGGLLPPTIAGGLGDANLADLKIEPGSVPPLLVPNSLQVTDYTQAQDARIARKVEGKVFVPCYLDQPGCPPGAKFLLGPGGLPQRNAVPHQAGFTCHIPRVSLGVGAGTARISLYGHGLLGSRGEIGQGQLKDFGQEKNVVFCSVDWIGMACADVEIPNPEDPAGFVGGILADIAAGNPPNAPNCDLPNVLTMLQDLSLFPALADRVQQGILNFLYVGRLMAHPQGLGALPAFQVSGQSILDTERDGKTDLNYDGNSQGGIIGGALAAVAVDHEKSTLGVPGMNYSTLLRRSVDFDSYAQGNFEGVETPLGMYDSYPNELERPLILSLIQLLWDRAEANGYAHHMTDDPYPNTPSHDVLLHVGFGDHQVADVSAQVEARTIGARLHLPGLDPDRPRYLGRPAGEKNLSWHGLPSIGYPFNGSGLVFWDIGPLRPADCEAPGPPDCAGTPPPPPGNLPPRTGIDPHEFPRRSAAARSQKSAFFDGSLIDVCGGGPCYAGDWTGTP